MRRQEESIMLGSSFVSSSHEEAAAAAAAEEEEPPIIMSTDLHLEIQQHHHHHRSSPAAVGKRELLITCAEFVSKSDFSSAARLLSVLSSNSSPFGDSTERLVHQFSRALSIRLNHHLYAAKPSLRRCDFSTINTASSPSSSSSSSALLQAAAAAGGALPISRNYSNSINQEAAAAAAVVQSSYLSLNQITPFIRFSQLTANQAILEAVEGERAIHILDFNIMHGVQWPPLMQAIAERCSHTLHPPPTLRITGTGPDLDILHRTGDRLLKFAQSLGLRFQFHPLLLLNDDVSSTSVALYLHSAQLSILPDEALAVNCVLYLHRLLKDDSQRHDLRLFLHKIKSLKPKVVTLAEREANHNHPLFLHRFAEALDHYTAIFDSLEATLPPNSQERLAVEQIWFGREIADIVAAEGDNRRERHERFESWEVMLRSCGFTNVPLSPFALSQAKLLLRLHYPSEGYQFQILNHSFFLGWQTKPLFSVSSWH